jgi:hypothetical protein
MAEGGTVARDDHYWALELNKEKWPVRAHLIVGETGPGRFDYYLVACGDKLSKAWSGCWGTNGDQLPLQAHAVHCGLPQSGQADA